MKQWKKLVAAVLTLSMLVSGLYIVAPEAKEVKASASTTEEAGKIYAGSYAKYDAETKDWSEPSEVKGGNAKYVDSGILSVKMQPRDNGDGTYDLRLVSSVDTLNYKNVGFKVAFDADGDGEFEDIENPGEGEVDEVIEWKTDAVLTRINAAKTGITYKYSPKVIDTDSEYFVTGVLKGIQKLDNNFLVEPFWTTLDGERVYGESRWFSMNDSLDNNINIPVEMSEDDYNAMTTVTLDGTEVTVTDKYYYGGYAHLNLSVENKTALKSASVVAVGENTAVYRNLNSSYASTYNSSTGEYSTAGDTSWYEAYADTQTEFTIATAADLYGFASAATKAGNFEGKSVYLVADIELNDIAKINWKTGVVEEGYNPTTWTAVTRNTDDSTAIGFEGIFDGQMHSIKGLWINGSKLIQGLFGTIQTGSIIKNFKLEDSYIDVNRIAGGIVGKAMGGTIDTVYSEATVITDTNLYSWGTGGIVGFANKDTVINNCWNAGDVNCMAGTSGAYDYVGGIIGHTNGAKTTIKNCLNTGTISTASPQYSKFAGAIAGGTFRGSGGTFYIENCVGSGQMVNNSTNTADAGIATILGWAQTAKSLIRNSYGTKECWASKSYQCDETLPVYNVAQVNESTLYGAEGWATTLLNDDYWVAVEGGIPELKSFTNKTEEQLADVSAIKRVDTSWYNDTDTEFTLYTEEEYHGLTQLAGSIRNGARVNFSGKTIYLGADLSFNDGDASTWGEQAPGRACAPIGIAYYAAFDGTFDGQDHTISGLYMNDENATNTMLAMFGYLGGTAKNFRLINSYIHNTTVDNATAAVVGQFRSSVATVHCVENVYTDAIVESNGPIMGGIAGTSFSAACTIQNCEFAGKLISNGTTFNFGKGSMIGDIRGCKFTITSCLFSGDIICNAETGITYVGGIAGATKNSGASCVMSDCLSVGTITTPNASSDSKPAVYGLLGYGLNTDSTITNSYSTQEEWSSSLIGTTASINERFPQATLYGAGAYVHTSLNATNWAFVQGKTPQLKNFQTTVDADLTGIQKADTTWYTNNKDAETYTLSTAEELYGLAHLAKTYNFAGKTIELDANLTEPIDMQGERGVASFAIGSGSLPFAGNFDGNGKTIQGLEIEMQTSLAGMFGYIAAGSTISNFRLVDSHIEGTEIVGSIVGRSRGSVDTIYSNATVVATTKGGNGGIVGQAWDTAFSITNCWYDGNVQVNGTGISDSGGILGENRAAEVNISNCLYSGWIITNSTADAPCLGGINGTTGRIGSNAAAKTIISNCISTGDYATKSSNNNHVASIIGYAENTNSTVTNCYGLKDSWSWAFALIGGNTEDPDVKAAHLLPLDEMINDKLSSFADLEAWVFIQDGTPELKDFQQGTEYVTQ